MLDLQTFANEPFLIALRQLFVSLRIPVNYISELPADAADILGEHYRPAHPAQALIQEVYALGVVDDAAFENPTQTHLPNLTADYDGILIFGVMLKSPFGGNRGLLADITRAFNRAFPHLPVVVVFRTGILSPLPTPSAFLTCKTGAKAKKSAKYRSSKTLTLYSPTRGICGFWIASVFLRQDGMQLLISPKCTTTGKVFFPLVYSINHFIRKL
jgi:hypothetical protein